MSAELFLQYSTVLQLVITQQGTGNTVIIIDKLQILHYNYRSYLPVPVLFILFPKFNTPFSSSLAPSLIKNIFLRRQF